MPQGAPLAAEETGRALEAVRAWQADPAAPARCPRCDAPGLAITDCSARPHAEWYRLACDTCGLGAAVSIPLGAPVPGAIA